MQAHREQLKQAIPLVLKCKACASLQEARDEAIAAISSGLGVDSKEAQSIVEELEGLNLVYAKTRSTAGKDMVTWLRGPGR